MTPSFIGTLQNLVLAQAQECFWQKAVLEGSYKNGIVGRLAMKVADYYGNAVKEANEGIGSAAGFFPQVSRISFSLKKKHLGRVLIPFLTVMAGSHVGQSIAL